MSDQINSFDEVFREKLSEHTISPPDFVWDKIESKRSFGHVVANKISINWRTFGTMLLLLLGGGSSAILFGGEEEQRMYFETVSNEELEAIFEDRTQYQDKNYSDINESIAPDQTAILNNVILSSKSTPTEQVHPEAHIPDIELMASINQAAFTKPEITADERLNILIQNIEGWETAKPVTFNHYYTLNKMEKLRLIERSISVSPILSDIEYDYAQPVTKKNFWDRTSILLAFTPQSITKIMSAEYNLSSSYLKHRQESEHTRMAYTFEANLHYELKNHKFIETGVNFTQIYEEMKFSGEKRFSNQYDFIEIPLLLGYEDRNSKFGYQVKGGFGIQIFNEYDGYIYKKYERKEPVHSDGDRHYRIKGNPVKQLITRTHSLSQNQNPDEVLDLSKEEENPFRDNGVVNFHLAAGLTYYYSDKTTFVLTPYYRRNINSITKKSALFNERISYMGISFGTRINF